MSYGCRDARWGVSALISRRSTTRPGGGVGNLDDSVRIGTTCPRKLCRDRRSQYTSLPGSGQVASSAAGPRLVGLWCGVRRMVQRGGYSWPSPPTHGTDPDIDSRGALSGVFGAGAVAARSRW